MVFGEIEEARTHPAQSRKAAKSRSVKPSVFFAAFVYFAPLRETAVPVGRLRAGSNVRNDVDLYQRIAGDSGGGDGSPHRRFGAEAPLENFVHARVVLQVSQVNVALEALFHRGADLFELLLDLVEHSLGMHLDVPGLMVSDAGDEDQIAVGNHAVK